jgi:hypothetical protein
VIIVGKLSCKRCNAVAYGDSREEADAAIDHAVGQIIGKPCSGNEADMEWKGDSPKPAKNKPKEPYPKDSSTKTTTKSTKGK